MGACVQTMLRDVGLDVPPTAEPPMRVFHRLQLISSLIAAESPAGSGPRLLWRDAAGGVAVRPITGPLVIGRDPACDLNFENPRISRRHCALRPDEGGVKLEDLDSSNGTFVNGIQVEHRLLADGDVIELGGLALVYAGMER